MHRLEFLTRASQVLMLDVKVGQNNLVEQSSNGFSSFIIS